MTIDEFDKISLSLKRELMDEWKLKTPSIYALEGVAKRLLNMVKQLREQGDGTDSWLYSLKMDLDIFLADVRGKLQHDYDRGNKRYHSKWSEERTNLINIISNFRLRLIDRETEE